MNDKKRSGIFAGKGYYIALILCAAAIGVTSYVYYRNDKDLEEVKQVQVRETQAEAIVGTMEAQDVPVIATETQPRTTTGETAPSAATAPTTAATVPSKPLKTTSPVSGDAIAGYSMEALSYNQTTRDWRVHNGIDLAAETGAEVKAAADGQVTAVYEDDSLGTTVEISHVGGYVTRYCSLSEDLAVKAGDQVTLGQTIGFAGDTALVETAMGSHVHFSVTCQGEPMDPQEFIQLGQ